MRKNVSSDQNIWINSGQVDSDDLTLEQNYVNDKISSMISNHLGQGALPDLIDRNILFNSSLISGNIDGIVLNSQLQPSDELYGNQLEIELINSNVFSLRTVKAVVFGLNFSNELIYETFVFSRNESQVGKLHFKNIVSIIVNDISGPTNVSLNLGGILKIYEVKQNYLSRDCLTVSQNIQPNLFWRNFFSVSSATLEGSLSSALPGYDLSQLNIFTSEKNVYELAKNDISTEFGQKFKSASNNIQKIRLLMSVENNDPGDELDLEWTGNLVFSIYPLQSKITCPSDIAPNLEIEFDPINIPLAQLTFDFDSLKSNGFVLTNSFQPIDLVFSNTSIANGKNIQKDSFYCVTIKRIGSADKCDIKLYSGSSTTADMRISNFNGNYWSDISSESFWFEVYSDSAKVSSSMLYEDGFGIEIPKTKYDDSLSSTIDYSLDKLSFFGNSIYTGIIYSSNEYFDKVEDKRTGSQVNSKQKKSPTVELLNPNELLNYSNDSLKFGVISDKNNKFRSSNNVSFDLTSFCFVKNEMFIPIIEDTTDPRYSSDLISLKSSFLNGELFKAKITPDQTQTSIYYRIGEAQIEELIYGDLNRDGNVDELDFEIFNQYADFNLNASPKLNSAIVVSPLAYNNGYLFLTTKAVSKSSLQFYLINTLTNSIVTSASDGIILPIDNKESEFSSATVNFTSLVTDTVNFIVYVVDTENGNNGYFQVSEVNTITDVIKLNKKYLDQDTLLKLLSANINGDFLIDSDDGYLIESYLERNVITSFPSLSYPAPTTSPYSKVGTKFSVLRLKLEKFEDTHDDQYSSTRSTNLHPIQDLFIDNTNLRDRDFSASSVSSLTNPQLVWEDYLVISTSNIKLVLNSIVNQTGSNIVDNSTTKLYPTKLEFDSGTNNTFVPNNIIIGDGNILNKDGSFYKVDFEVGSLIIEVPDNFFGTEKTLNVFNSFVYESANGKTSDGFNAMKFADSTYVQSDAIQKNQVRFSVSIQSFSPVLDGYDGDLTGIIVDPKMGVFIDNSTGLLRLNFTNIYKDLTKPTLSTKIQVNVFIKKSGFNNEVSTLKSELVNNLFV